LRRQGIEQSGLVPGTDPPIHALFYAQRVDAA